MMISSSCDALETFDNLVDYLDEPAGGSVATLRHDEPLDEPVRCTEGGEGNGILVNGNLVEGGDGIEQGKDASFTQGIEDLVDAGDGELSERADGIQLLAIHGDAGPHPSWGWLPWGWHREKSNAG